MKINLNDPELVLQLTEEQRLILIGYSASMSELGAAPKGEHELKKRGETWFNTFILNIKPYICESERIIKLRTLVEDQNEVQLCLTIADIIVTAVGSTIPPFVVSAQIVKIGLKNICDDNNK